MDPRGVGKVQIELNNTAAQLLASLCVELETEDVGDVLSRALGLLDLCIKSKGKGARVCLVDDRGEASEVVI